MATAMPGTFQSFITCSTKPSKPLRLGGAAPFCARDCAGVIKQTTSKRASDRIVSCLTFYLLLSELRLNGIGRRHGLTVFHCGGPALPGLPAPRLAHATMRLSQ